LGSSNTEKNKKMEKRLRWKKRRTLKGNQATGRRKKDRQVFLSVCTAGLGHQSWEKKGAGQTKGSQKWLGELREQTKEKRNGLSSEGRPN